jgi:hypothetical protein
MMVTLYFGHNAQVDLINMSSKCTHGYNYILRYVNHLWGFLHVGLCCDKSAEEVGVNLIQKLSMYMVPEIIQSDNESNFFVHVLK